VTQRAEFDSTKTGAKNDPHQNPIAEDLGQALWFGDVTGLGPQRTSGWRDRFRYRTGFSEPGKVRQGERCNGRKPILGVGWWCHGVRYVPVTRAASVCNGTKNQNMVQRDWDHLQYNQDAQASLEAMNLLAASPCILRHAVALPGLVWPCNSTGQLDSATACPDWPLAGSRGCPAAVIGFVACSARCNSGTQNVKVEGWTPPGAPPCEEVASPPHPPSPLPLARSRSGPSSNLVPLTPTLNFRRCYSCLARVNLAAGPPARCRPIEIAMTGMTC
jgi:hypothetical protein